MTHRDPLAAALARAEAAEAALARATAGAATPVRRWTVRSPGYGALTGSAAGLALSVAQGHSRLAHAAVALAACAVVWALCFVRRVPVDGGDR
jgi:hypothetical protein